MGLSSILRRPRVSRWLRRLALAAMTLTAVALLGGAALLGWMMRDWFDAPRTSITVSRPVTVVREAQPAAGAMPNLLGLDEQTARQAIADAGLDAAKVVTSVQPYAGERDVVIQQDPAPGAAPGKGKIALDVSGPAAMPKLIGQTFETARTSLAALGTTVLIKNRYQPNAPENVVLATQPAAGRHLSDRATVVVAEPPSSVFLAQLRAINSSCGSQTLNMVGVQRQNALVCQPGEGSPADMDYVLNRHVASFAAVVGLGDRGATDTPATFRVFVDGKRVAAETLSFGQTRKLIIPVVGALRIRLEAAVARNSQSGQYPEVVWANARFLGGQSAINNLVAESNQ